MRFCLFGKVIAQSRTGRGGSPGWCGQPGSLGEGGDTCIPEHDFWRFFESSLNYLNLCKHEEGLLPVLGVAMNERGREHLIPRGV